MPELPQPVIRALQLDGHLGSAMMLLLHPFLSGGGLAPCDPTLLLWHWILFQNCSPRLPASGYLSVQQLQGWVSMSVVFLLAVPFMEEAPVLSLLLPPAALGSTGSTDPVGACSGGFPEVM